MAQPKPARGILDRRTLYAARWPNVLRLAKALGVRPMREGCPCQRCVTRTIEAIVRRL